MSRDLIRSKWIRCKVRTSVRPCLRNRLGLVFVLIISAVFGIMNLMNTFKNRDPNQTEIETWNAFTLRTENDFFNIYNTVNQIPNESAYGHIELKYVPYPSSCHVTNSVRGYRNLCWISCNGHPCTSRDLWTSRQFQCAPRIVLLGVRKCGTTDLSSWLHHHPGVMGYNRDFDMTHGQCASAQATKEWLKLNEGVKHPEIYLRKSSLFNDAPGQILMHQNLGMNPNRTMLYVRPTFHHLKTIETEETRYILILRDPARRAISQLFHWHKLGLINQHISFDDLTPRFIHSVIVEQVNRTSDCFREFGPHACIYMIDPRDGSMEALLIWGLYIEYIEEAFKSIEKQKIMIIDSNEYSKNERDVALRVFKFVGLPMDPRLHDQDYKLNVGEKKEVHPETTKLLQEFYKPFNRRLAQLLGDEKWCFSAC